MDDNRDPIPRAPDGRWLPGVSGNPSGRPVDRAARLIREAYERVIDEKTAEAFVRAVVDGAIEGDAKKQSHVHRAHGLFTDNLNLAGAEVIWNWQPGGQPAEAEAGKPGADDETETG